MCLNYDNLLLILANISVLTVWINYTLWSTSSNCIWFWYKALIASENKSSEITITVLTNEPILFYQKIRRLKFFLTYKWHFHQHQPCNERQDHMVKDHKDLVFQHIFDFRKHIHIHSQDL